MALTDENSDSSRASASRVFAASTSLSPSAEPFAPTRARDDSRAAANAALEADVLRRFTLERRARTGARERFQHDRTRVKPSAARARRARGAFAHANFQYRLADCADLRACSNDADAMASWDDVARVESMTEDELTCPICFDDKPRAGRITTCGHVFCFPCIARHVLSTRRDGTPAKCPMCFDEIRLGDLRSVRRRAIERTRAGATQKFTLVWRERRSNVPAQAGALAGAKAGGKAGAPPRANEWPRALTHCACDAFAKYTLTKDEVALATEELESLESYVAELMEREDVGAGDLPYALASVDALTRQIDRMVERRCMSEGVSCPPRRSRPIGVVAPAPAKAKAPAPPQEFPALPTAPKNMAYIAGAKVRVESAFSEDEDENDEAEDEGDTLADEESSEPRAASIEPTAVPKVKGTEKARGAGNDYSTGNERTDIYYFYQAPDGQQVFLHSACMKVLLEHHGSYGALPLEIEGVVVDLERNTQDEDSRRRAAHIRHLPLATEFVMVELDMKAHVPKKVLDSESGSELRLRAKRRAQKLAAEERAKSKELRAEAKLKSQPFSKSVRDSMPELGAEPRTPDTSMDAALAKILSDEASEHLERVAMREEVANARGPGGISFSNVVGRGFAAGVDAPSLRSAEKFPALGATQQPPRVAVWGARTSKETDLATSIPKTDDRNKKGKSKGTLLFRIG